MSAAVPSRTYLIASGRAGGGAGWSWCLSCRGRWGSVPGLGTTARSASWCSQAVPRPCGAGLEGRHLVLGEQGAEHLPVGLAERDRPVEVGGKALEFVQVQAVVQALLDLGEPRADHPGDLADGALGGVDSAGGGVDGVGGGPVAVVDELAELVVGDAVVVHGGSSFVRAGLPSGGGFPPPEGAGVQAVRARVAARAMTSMVSAGSVRVMTWASFHSCGSPQGKGSSGRRMITPQPVLARRVMRRCPPAISPGMW